MKEVLISSMGSIVLDMVCSTLGDKLDTLKEWRKTEAVKRDIHDAIEHMILDHDGTILTSQELSEYLKNYKVIEEIFDSIWCPGHEVCGETELIAHFTDQCKSVIKEKGRKIPAGEEELIRKFFTSIITILIRAAQQESTHGEHILQMQMKDFNNDVLNSFAEMKDWLKQSTLLSVDDENSVFDAVYNWFCKGDFQEVQEMLPLLEGKSSNIKVALEALLILVTSDSYEPKQVVKLIAEIKNDCIRDICAGFIIAYGFIWPDVTIKLSQEISNASLVKVAENLCNKKWEEIIQTDKSAEQPKMSVVVNTEYPHDSWFKTRVIFWYLNEEKDRFPVQINEGDFAKPISLLDDWLLAKEKTNFFRTAVQIEELKQTRNKLLEQKEMANMVCAEIKKLYWKTLFEICMKTKDADTILKMWSQIPAHIQTDSELKEALFYAEILNKSVDEERLIGFCISVGDPSLLLTYCYDKSDEKIIALYDRCKSFFDSDYRFFEMYIKARLRSSPCGNEKSLIESRKNDFQKWLPYWNLCDDQDIVIDFKDVYKKVCNEELIMSMASVVCFGHKLLNHSYLAEAEQLNEKYKTALSLETEYPLFYARILLCQEKQIEALTILQSVEEDYQSTAFVIENILRLSITHKRPVSERTISFAKKIDTLQGWRLLAHYYAEKNNAKLAMNAVTKALLRAKSEDVFAYVLYLVLHSKFCNKEFEQIKKIGGNTCVLLHDPKTKRDTEICIYSDQVLPQKGKMPCPYIWEGAMHMENEEAIKKGLCFQGVGDEVVVDGITYVVKSIKPVDAFLYAKAMGKGVENKSITLLEIPKQENGEINLAEFVSAIKRYIPQREDPLVKYKNPEGIPATLFLLSQSRNMTYGQFIDVLLHDPTIVVRNIHSVNSMVQPNNQYVLSFAVAILLFGMGLDLKMLGKNNVSVPSSMREALEGECSIIQLEKSQDVVASLYFEGERPVVHEETNATKRYFVQEALKFKTECDKLNAIENTQSVSIDGGGEIELKEMLGVCDYDAISLAYHQGGTLVAFEPVLVALSTEHALGFRCIGVVDLLCEINAPLDIILKTLCQLAEYRFENLLSEENWEYLVSEFERVEDDEYREMCMTLWFEFLGKIDELEPNDEYKIVFLQSVLISFRDFWSKFEELGKTDAIAKNPMASVAAFLLAGMMGECQNDRGEA